MFGMKIKQKNTENLLPDCPTIWINCTSSVENLENEETFGF